MSQVLVSPNDISGTHFTIKDSEAHHLLRVLRKQVNDNVDLFDGKGHRYRGRLTAVDPKATFAQGEITETLPVAAKPWHFHLFQGVPKGAKFDFVIEKATELGAASITPFLSQKSVIQLSDSQAQIKTKRWNQLAEAAAKQCDRADIPIVHLPRKLMDLGPALRKARCLVLDTEKSSLEIKAFLKSLPEAGSLNIVIGPESGFSSHEREWLKSNDIQSFSLGSSVLRTETAGLAALSILSYELNT